MAVQTTELFALLPLTAIAFAYWIRDRYAFNRVGDTFWSATAVQRQVLVFVYPMFVFLYWLARLQVKRGHSGIAIVSTFGTQILLHYGNIAILNDSFRQTRQQLVGFVITLLFGFGWTLFDMTMYGSDGCR